jgi:hypothetical protein
MKENGCYQNIFDGATFQIMLKNRGELHRHPIDRPIEPININTFDLIRNAINPLRVNFIKINNKT